MFGSVRFRFGKQNFNWLVWFGSGWTVKHCFGRSLTRTYFYFFLVLCRFPNDPCMGGETLTQEGICYKPEECQSKGQKISKRIFNRLLSLLQKTNAKFSIRLILNMAIRVVEFSSGGYKIRKILHKNQQTQRKLLNFEFWINGELSKIGHHFSNKVI